MKIAVFCSGESWGNVNPEALERGLGGRETAAIQLARQWAILGHHVHVFAVNEGATHESHDSGGEVSYVDFNLCPAMITAFPYDVVLSWEEPSIFSLPNLKQWQTITVCGMQVAHITHGTIEDIANTDCWVALSPWHAEFLGAQFPPEMTPRMSVKPNCIDLDRYPSEKSTPYRWPREAGLRFLYASSPDRGLHHVLRAWPKLRDRYPGCELHIAYGARKWANEAKWSHFVSGDIAAEVLARLAQPGIIDHGKVGQGTLAELHQAADFLLYPCDPVLPTETGCITVVEACAAQNVPVLTETDCLPSEFADVAVFAKAPYEEDDYLAVLDALITDPDKVNELRARGREFALTRSWSDIAEEWIGLFDSVRSDVYPAVA